MAARARRPHRRPRRHVASAAAGRAPSPPRPARPDRGPQDLQALHRRARSRAPRAAAPTSSRGADGTPLANACRASRKDLRDAVRAARKAFPGWADQDRDEPRPGPLPRRRADGGPARPVRRRGRAAEGLRAGAAARASSTARSTAGSGTPAGPTRSPRCSGSSNPVAAPVLQLHDPRADRASSASSRPETSSLLGLVSRLAPPLVARQQRRRAHVARRRPLPAITLTEVLATSDVPGGVVNVLTGPQARSSCRCSPRHVDVDALDTWGVPDDAAHWRPSCSPPTTSSASRAARRRVDRGPLRLARRPRRRAPRVDRRLPRDEDGLAPDRGLTMAVGDRRSVDRRRRPLAARRTGRGRAPGLRPGVAAHRLGDAPRPRRDRAPSSPSCSWARPHRPGRPRRRPGRRGPASACCATLARVESLEARPESRLPPARHGLRVRQRVELAPGAGRRGHARHPRRDVRAVRSLDGDPGPLRATHRWPAGSRRTCGRSRSAPSRRARHRRPREGRRPRRPGERPAAERRAWRAGQPASAVGSDRPGDSSDAALVPFAGLRRNARALAGGLLLLLVIGSFVPDLTPPPTEPPRRRTGPRPDRRVPARRR